MEPHVVLCGLLALQLVVLASGRQLLRAGALPPPPPLATLPSAFLPVEGADQQLPSGTVEMKIINGQPAPAADFGFMVALLRDERFFCGGTLLDATSVLTAAHCVVDTGLVDDPSPLTVWRIDGTQYAVDKIFAHPGYSASTIPNDNIDLTFTGNLHDLAVLKLATPVPSPVAVTLANATTQLVDSQPLQVAGWGTTESGQPSTILKYATVDYLPAADECPADYSDVLCAGGTGENTCNGDSGGPLLIRDATTGVAAQVGLTSHGPDCLSSLDAAYGYYTDLRKYLDVIASFQNGTQIPWPPTNTSSSPGGGGGGSTNTLESGGGALAAASPPPPGSSSSPAVGFIPGSDSSGQPGWGLGSLNEIFCKVFGCATSP